MDKKKDIKVAMYMRFNRASDEIEYKNNKSQSLFNFYNEKEIKKILDNKTRLVYVDTGIDEVVAKYEDISDIIVDINDKLGFANIKVYNYLDFFGNPILTTNGKYLNKCDSDVREDIIGRLVQLQTHKTRVKNYKLIDEDVLEDLKISLEQEQIERNR